MMTPEAMDMSPSRILPPPPRKPRRTWASEPMRPVDTVAATVSPEPEFAMPATFDDPLDEIEKDAIQRDQDRKAEIIADDLDLRDDLNSAADEIEFEERVEETRQLDGILDDEHEKAVAATANAKETDDRIAEYLAGRSKRLDAERRRREKPEIVFEKTLDAERFAKGAEGWMRFFGIAFLTLIGRKNTPTTVSIAIPEAPAPAFLRNTLADLPVVGERARKASEEKFDREWTDSESRLRAREVFGHDHAFHALGNLLSGRGGEREKAVAVRISPAVAELVNGNLPDEWARQQRGFRAFESRGYTNRAHIAEKMLDRVVTGADKALAARNAAAEPEDKPGTPPDNGAMTMQPGTAAQKLSETPTTPAPRSSPF